MPGELLTDELTEWVGREVTYRAPEPVGRAALRYFARAVGDDNPVYTDRDAAIDAGVQWLTVYAFSTENWKRPKDEVRFLINFNEEILLRRQDELHARNVRIRFVGRRDWRVPKRLIRRMDESVELTKNNTGLTFTIAFNYGGRAEIVDAVRRIVDNGTPADKINEKTIARELYDPDMPDPDLMIRTSGEYRISNFLLWELAYSELLFTDTPWPEFGRDALIAAIHEYQTRDRRFGGVDTEG